MACVVGLSMRVFGSGRQVQQAGVSVQPVSQLGGRQKLPSASATRQRQHDIRSRSGSTGAPDFAVLVAGDGAPAEVNGIAVLVCRVTGVGWVRSRLLGDAREGLGMQQVVGSWWAGGQSSSGTVAAAEQPAQYLPQQARILSGVNARGIIAAAQHISAQHQQNAEGQAAAALQRTCDALDPLPQWHLLVRQRRARSAVEGGQWYGAGQVWSRSRQAQLKPAASTAASQLQPAMAAARHATQPHQSQNFTHLYTASGLSWSARTTASMHSGSISGSSPCSSSTEQWRQTKCGRCCGCESLEGHGSSCARSSAGRAGMPDSVAPLVNRSPGC